MSKYWFSSDSITVKLDLSEEVEGLVMTNRYAKIISTGRYVPERIMTNAEFEPLVGDVDAWLR
jgi:hypothetical protein